MWPFAKKKVVPVSTDRLGPDKPRVLIKMYVERVVIDGYRPGLAKVVLGFDSAEIVIYVEKMTAIERFPVSEWVTFVMEDCK